MGRLLFLICEFIFLPINVPILKSWYSGTNSIWVYERDPGTGRLELVNEVESVREHDGPRHVLPHPNGRYLYVVCVYASVSVAVHLTSTYR